MNLSRKDVAVLFSKALKFNISVDQVRKNENNWNIRSARIVINPRVIVYKEVIVLKAIDELLKEKIHFKKQQNKIKFKYHTPKDSRVSSLSYRYGVSEEKVRSVISGVSCEICGHVFGFGLIRRKRCLDHDHTTGKMRGCLCFQCNSALGLLRENIQTLENAIAYIKKYQGC